MVKYVLLSLGVVGLLVFGSGVASQSSWPASQQERFVVRVPDDFLTIQEAIEAVAEGGTVLIRSGTYQENLKISKSLRLRGASQESVQIHPFGHGSVTIDIASERPIQVYLEDFTVKNRGFLSSKGIKVGGYGQALIERITVSGYEDGDGIRLSNSSAILSSVKVSYNRTGISIGGDGDIIIQEASITENDIGILSVGFLGEPYLTVRRSLFFLNRVMAVGLIGGLYGGLAATLDGNQIVKNFGGVYVGRYYQPDLVKALLSAEPGPPVIAMYNNQINGNLLYGIAISLLECLKGMKDDDLLFSLLFSSSDVIFTGRDNDIKDNGKGDLCPADYPWPPGFRK